MEVDAAIREALARAALPPHTAEKCTFRHARGSHPVALGTHGTELDIACERHVEIRTLTRLIALSTVDGDVQTLAVVGEVRNVAGHEF